MCHSSAPGRALGPRTEQLNRSLPYAGGARNQLEVLSALGLFELPGAPDALPRLADPADPGVDIEARARSYLHANCAHCHQPGGWVPGELAMDLRTETPLSEAMICDVPTQYFDNGGARRLQPGAPDASALLVRMRATDDKRMPPLASARVDPLAEALMVEWIEGLVCP